MPLRMPEHLLADRRAEGGIEDVGVSDELVLILGGIYVIKESWIGDRSKRSPRSCCVNLARGTRFVVKPSQSLDALKLVTTYWSRRATAGF